MTEENKNKLDDKQLDAVAGGTEGAGMLYPGQTDVPQQSDWASASGLGPSGSGFSLDPSKQNKLNQ